MIGITGTMVTAESFPAVHAVTSRSHLGAAGLSWGPPPAYRDGSPHEPLGEPVDYWPGEPTYGSAVAAERFRGPRHGGFSLADLMAWENEHPESVLRFPGPAGHLAVWCAAAPDCRSVWYQPRV